MVGGENGSQLCSEYILEKELWEKIRIQYYVNAELQLIRWNVLLIYLLHSMTGKRKPSSKILNKAWVPEHFIICKYFPWGGVQGSNISINNAETLFI